MKQIISSKGKFNITDSLYESIKKNNPELLMEDDSSFNVFAAYDGKVNDIIQKLKLNNNEIDDLKKRIKSYENSVKDSFGANHSDKAYKVCDFYLDNLYKSANGSKDNFLKNLSSKYEPDVITKMINKNKPKSNDDTSPTDEEILDTISSSTSIPVNELSDEQKEELISTYDDEVDKSNGKNDNAWNEVGKKAEELYNKKAVSSGKEKKKIGFDEITSGKTEDDITINNDDWKKFFQVFETNYLSDETLKFIDKLYHKYNLNKINVGDEYIPINLSNNDMTKKKICIYNIWNMINNNLNESVNNNKILIENDIKWTNAELNDARKEMEETAFMKDIRKAILGIINLDNSDNIYNNLKKVYSSEAIEDIKKDTKKSNEMGLLRLDLFNKLRNNENNLLNYLTYDEWQELLNTLTIPAQGDNPEEKLNDAYERTKKVINLIDICTFDTRIPGAITNFYDKIKNQVKKRTVVGLTCNFKDFGQQTPKGFILGEPKDRYVNSLKNFGIMYKNISAFDAYRAIPQKEFWKNVAYVDCRTKESLGIITAALGDLSNRNEVNIQQRMISTGLNTNTIIYTLVSNNDNILSEKGLVLNRENKPIEDIDYNSLSPDEKNIIKLIKRRYFIIVSEGMFRKGEMASKLVNKAKNYFGSNNTPKFDTKDMVRIK